MRINNPPRAAALMATARSFGNYDLAAALADLIDNSIHAQAQNVRIDIIPRDDDLTVRIRDDGNGMDRQSLIEAMRPASSNPEDVREKSDLGRFGWGMKSASFSQARVLTVVSWRSNSINSAQWDIDDLDNWNMDVLESEEALALLASDRKSASGTEVIWNKCDRLFDAGLNATLDERLNSKISHAKRHLALVFHRYLTGIEVKRLNIFLQGVPISPVDPFMSSHTATQMIGEERIQLKPGAEISITPYVLPHFSKLDTAEKTLYGGDEGMVRNQGFYVYRNKRLIIYGTWFRLIPHGELTQLTRVRIDLPNNLDAEWKITLDKSDAQLPAILRRRLGDVVRKFSKRSYEVHRRRGVDLVNFEYEPVWKRNAYNGRIRYLINREHPLIAELLSKKNEFSLGNEILKLVESCVPVDAMHKDISSEGEDLVQAITDSDEFEALITACLAAFIRRVGRPPKLAEFLDFIKKIEPFAGQWKYAASYVSDISKKNWNLKND